MSASDRGRPAQARIAPAPWSLTGSGYIVLLRLPPRSLRSDACTPADLTDRLLPGLSLMMFVDYQTSPVGPYRELLFIPGRLRIDGSKRWSITRIVVDSPASVVSGRANWGIPKQLATIDVERQPDGTEWIEVSQDGRRMAELVFDTAGPTLPVDGAIIPRRLRTMSQFRGGTMYSFSPDASGPVSYARLRAVRTDRERFPEVRTGNVMMALRAPRFELTFPIAETTEEPAPIRRR
jgi:hypothetical protein